MLERAKKNRVGIFSLLAPTLFVRPPTDLRTEQARSQAEAIASRNNIELSHGTSS